MPKYSKMTIQKRDELTAKFIAELKAQSLEGNSEAARTLNIYSYIDNLGRSTRDQRFYYLSCERMLLMLKCPTEGHDSENIIRGRKFCHQRHWCFTCAWDAIERQLRRWMIQIRLSLCRPTECMYLGPLVRLSWPNPNAEGPANLASFSNYIKQTFSAKLEAAGALKGSWMLTTAFNPLKNEYQALYIGTSVDWSMICEQKKRKNSRITTSVVAKGLLYLATTEVVIGGKKGDKKGGKKGRGQPSPWKPKKLYSVHLLDDENNPVTAAEKFFHRIREGFQWVLGDASDVFLMTPEQAFKFQKRYRSRRLTSTYGMVYGASEILNLPIGSLTILVDRRESDGTISVETIDPVALVGSIPGEHACQIDTEDKVERNRCAICEAEKRLKLEEDRSFNISKRRPSVRQ